MPYVSFEEYFPELARKETRTIKVTELCDLDLPAGTYSFIEMFCNEKGCDCRRVFFYVVSSFRERVEAVVAWGWESEEFYRHWIKDDDLGIISTLKGPTLNQGSPQSKFAPAILDLVEDILLQDESYVERVKAHYKMFRKKVDSKEKQKKIGRNDPCPCGSGKKYKKCCALNEKEIDFSIPEDCMTDTPLDDYMMLLKAIMFYGQSIIEFGKDGKDLLRKSGDFVERFKPGTDTGIFDSLYMGWLYMDCRFGKSGLTVAERFMKEDYYKKMEETGKRHIEDMANSYCSFYQVCEKLDDWVWFKELGTGRKCKVYKINEEFERDSREGFIWYVRFVGIPEEGYPIGTPYVLTAQEATKLEETIKKYKMKSRKESKHAETEQEYFREYCREYTHYWAEFIVKKNEIGTN